MSDGLEIGVRREGAKVESDVGDDCTDESALVERRPVAGAPLEGAQAAAAGTHEEPTPLPKLAMSVLLLIHVCDSYSTVVSDARAMACGLHMAVG